ncbi:hypothetical protein OU798_08295 [Prolixibacteraceae bacterium Z1-6]|uniref:Uncharacterized protein n=1 Tax=Draconibacterium aestuarii TaxID=2998507 RepID=A0A9X3FCZ0_9BACT|nr:hypothetical protein [Prolixibacteraceae bacterium Z1-6]
MKTKNNVQQTILKSMAVIFSVVILSTTVNAQDFWKSVYENNGFKDIAIAMNETKAKPATVSSHADLTSYYAEENEETLEIENWMMNEDSFGTFISFEVESESPMVLENWMTNESYFNYATEMFLEETESELEIEDWMLNENLFNATGEDEQPLKLESWMISDKVWNV